MAAQADARSITSSLPRALPKSARVKVEHAIQAHQDAAHALLDFLDQIDGDADFEPYLGSGDDREVDVGDEGESGADDDLSCEDFGAPSNVGAV
jgi:hypothetical protein